VKYSTLGNSGAVVSNRALGTMTFGSSTDEAEARRQLDLFLNVGGTLVETADIYNDGASETIVGRWLEDLKPLDRSRIFLASKGRFPVGVEPRDAGLSRRHLARALNASLTRLNVDHIDLYQLHAWDPLTPLEESLGFLDDAIAAGKVAYAGLSNFTGWQIQAAADLARGRFPLISMQPQYSLLVREIEWEIVPACAHNGLGILPWSPLGGGWLSGKYSLDVPPPPSTRLGDNPDSEGMEAWHRRNRLRRTGQVLTALKTVAAEIDATAAQVALAWLETRPHVTSIILGARTAKQLRENLAAGALQLAAAHQAALDDASDPQPSDYPYGPPGIEQRSRTI
jgi:aryl-alcohol dehydrogenase-like predicted oxidoreductase